MGVVLANIFLIGLLVALFSRNPISKKDAANINNLSEILAIVQSEESPLSKAGHDKLVKTLAELKKPLKDFSEFKSLLSKNLEKSNSVSLEEVKSTVDDLLKSRTEKQKKEILDNIRSLSEKIEGGGGVQEVQKKVADLQEKINVLIEDSKKHNEAIRAELKAAKPESPGNAPVLKLLASQDDKLKSIETQLKKLELQTGLPVAKPAKEFLGPRGNIAVMATNSEDFKLNSSILSALLEIVEAQNRDAGEFQRLGLYVVTGNRVDIKFDLKKKTRGEDPTGVAGSPGRPTENLHEVGKTLVETAFDEKSPETQRRIVVVATWEANAPKHDQPGWGQVESVDVILLQTKPGLPFRDAGNWLEFCKKKKGKLQFVQGNNDFTTGSSSLDQLKRNLNFILKGREEKP
ncbi:MAG: hypothetical protein EXR99_16865 [Gemmataceae bacterium]|nr:hypothetical protein [Gemmataceae bacterium]